MRITICCVVPLLTLGFAAPRDVLAQAPAPPAAAAAASRADALQRQLAAAESRLVAAQQRLAALERRAALPADPQRLAQLEGRWRLAFWAIVGLSLVLAVIGAVAAIAQRRARGALHFARSMAQELDERRRVGLAEREQSARRIVELEDCVRQLEAQVRDPGQSVSRRA